MAAEGQESPAGVGAGLYITTKTTDLISAAQKKGLFIINACFSRWVNDNDGVCWSM